MLLAGDSTLSFVRINEDGNEVKPKAKNENDSAVAKRQCGGARGSRDDGRMPDTAKASAKRPYPSMENVLPVPVCPSVHADRRTRQQREKEGVGP